MNYYDYYHCLPCGRHNNEPIAPNMKYYYPASTASTAGLPSPYIQGMPTGIPAGPQVGPIPLPAPGAAQMPEIIPDVDGEMIPQSVLSSQYIQGYLRRHIGRKVKIEFLIGTSMLIDREGTLLEVGTSYVVIQETETDDKLLCDLYSIKFVKIYY